MKQLFIVAVSLLALSFGTSDVIKSLDFQLNYTDRVTILDEGRQTAATSFISSTDTIDDKVDLNDIFGSPGDLTDWNYTEIDAEDWAYLDSIGIYWDEKSECYRKRK